MNAAKVAAWLGYQASGGRLELDPGSLVHGAAVLGHGAPALTSSIARSLDEVDCKVAVIDFDGSLSKAVSGHIQTYDASYVLHDSLLMNENGPLQAMLLASAYSTVLDLPNHQEALLNAAIQSMALEHGEASPTAIVPMIDLVEGFKGPDKNEVSGRIGAMKLLDSAGDEGAVARVLQRSCAVDFSGAKTYELAEASAAIVLAKMLAAPHDAPSPDVIVIGEAQRLFRAYRVPRHGSTLRSALLSAPFGAVFSASRGYALDRNIVDGCSVRFYSPEIWNALRHESRVMPNMFIMQDHSRGTAEPFVPREFRPGSGVSMTGTPAPSSDRALARTIMELVETWPTATKVSVVAYLSADYSSESVSSEIGRLQSDGSLIFYKPALGTDSPNSVLRVSEVGKLYLKELRESGETSDPV